MDPCNFNSSFHGKKCCFEDGVAVGTYCSEDTACRVEVAQTNTREFACNPTTDGRHVPIPCTTSHFKDTHAICQFTQVTTSRKEQLCAHDLTLDVLPFAICCTATHFNDFLDSSSLEHALGEGTQRKDSTAVLSQSLIGLRAAMSLALPARRCYQSSWD